MRYSVVNVEKNSNGRVLYYYISPIINGEIDISKCGRFSRDEVINKLKNNSNIITNLEYRRNTNSLHLKKDYEQESQLDKERFYYSILNNSSMYFNNFELPKQCLNKLSDIIDRSEKNHKVLQNDLYFGISLCNVIGNFFEYLHPIKYREKERLTLKNLLKKDINDRTLLFKESTNRNLSSDINVYNRIPTTYHTYCNATEFTNNGDKKPEVYSIFETVLSNMWGINKILPNKTNLKSTIRVLKKFFNNIKVTNLGEALYYEYIKSMLNILLDIRNNNWSGSIPQITMSDNDRYNILLDRVVSNSVIAKKKGIKGTGLNRFNSKKEIKKKLNNEYDKYINRVNGEMNPIDLQVSAALQNIANLTPSEFDKKSSEYKLDTYINLYYKRVRDIFDTVHNKIKIVDDIQDRGFDVSRWKIEAKKLLEELSKGSLKPFLNRDIKGMSLEVGSEIGEDYCKGLFNENLAEIIKSQKLNFKLSKFDINLLASLPDKIFEIYRKEVIPYAKNRIRKVNRGYQSNSIIDGYNVATESDRDIIMYYVCLMLYKRQLQTESGLRKVNDDLKPLLSYCISKNLVDSSYSIYRFRKSEVAWLVTYLIVNDKLSGLSEYSSKKHTVYYRLFKYVYKKLTTEEYIDNQNDLTNLKVNYNWHIFDENTFPINVINLF